MTACALTAPMPLIPTTATFTRSLGAWKPRPRTWRGTMVTPTAAVATLVMNSRRLFIGFSVKSQAPNPKLQRTPRPQTPTRPPSQLPTPWDLGVGSALGFGAWSLGFDLCAPCELPCLRMHLDLLALLDEERHADFQAGLECRQLGDAAAGGVAADTGLGRRHRQLDVRWE